MSSSLFSEVSHREVHPVILNYIQNALEDLPNDQAQHLIRLFLTLVESESSAASRLSEVDSSIHELLALYHSPTSASLIGAESSAAFQAVFKQTLQHYSASIASASQAASNPLPYLLGFRCFSLRTLATLGQRDPDELDAKIIRDYRIRADQFFARMSSSSMGMVVFVVKAPSLCRKRLALIYRPGESDNPFELRTINGKNDEEVLVLEKINQGVATNPRSPIDLGDGSSVIPLTADLPEILASLADPKANLANAKLTFSALIADLGYTPIDPPSTAAASSYASGCSAYAAYI